MSWSLQVIGRDKAKVKDAVRAAQCQDEEKNPHSGVPKRVADFVCSEIDRIRIYEYAGRTYGVNVEANGSFHEQGLNEFLKISPVQIVE
ncbi:MAG TPA: hypothetical protein VN878_05880 [Usitatibacter sp.]|nr:hypothetical protein [Usitatibacter sp.]